MKNVMKGLIGFVKKCWYFLLLIAAGSLAISESSRITMKYQPSNWIAGPSGFIMILGIILSVLLLFELLLVLLRANKRVRAGGAAVVSKESEDDAQTATASPGNAEKAGEDRLHTRNMWLSFGLLVLYTLLLKGLGFALASGAYLSANLFLLRNSWKISIITVAAIFIFLLYGAPALGISFPRGLFGF